MDKFPKFIIENGDLILSKVTFHKEIATNKDDVVGGGSFYYDSEDNSFTFSGSSYDFGSVSFNQVKQCVDNDRVFSNRRKRRSIAKDHKFFYNTGSETLQV